MLNWQQRSGQPARRVLLVVLLWAEFFCFASSTAIAQEQPQSSFLGSIAKQVVLDPTTYTPSVIAYDATVRDWNTSQPFFKNGFMEHNPRYTLSGLPNDVPVGYAEGNHRILTDAFANLGLSLVNNFSERIFERALMERYPDHRKVVKTLGWIERISFGAYMAYALSSDHYRQAGANALRAQQLGYR